MKWEDEGLILGVRRHGETSAILEVLTRDHGRHMGLVRGGASKRLKPILQVGNTVSLEWFARLEDHLGTFTVDLIEGRTARLIIDPVSLNGVQLLAAHCRLLPEREEHQSLYHAASVIVAEGLTERQVAGELMVRFELLLLKALGYGLELDQCADTGQESDLVYVSPKSGRAVCRTSGDPWKKKLFNLPTFLTSERLSHPPDDADIIEAWRLTGYFLDNRIYYPRGLEEPPVRRAFIHLFGDSANASLLDDEG